MRPLQLVSACSQKKHSRAVCRHSIPLPDDPQSLFHYRKRQANRIGVDRQRPEVLFLRRLDAVDVIGDQLLVEGVEIRDGRADVAMTGRHHPARVKLLESFRQMSYNAQRMVEARASCKLGVSRSSFGQF
jgi:hypothetical protein